MSRVSALAQVPGRLARAVCLPLMLLAPEIGLAEDGVSASSTVVATALTERSAALPPEHGQTNHSMLLTTFFTFDQVELTTASRRAIDAIAPRLRTHLADGGHVLIEGHADEAGMPRYNIDLSERRARAVAVYLRDAWEIPLPRLHLRAWGESDLRRLDQPHHAENRRVEITLLDGQIPRTRGVSLLPRAGAHLYIDDFGGAPNPLHVTGRIITAPAPTIRHH